LKGARIGVLTEFFGRDPVHQEVNAVTDAAIRKMADAGATTIRITIPALDDLTRNVQVAQYEAMTAFNSYLASLGSRAPVKTFDEFIARGEFHSSLAAGLNIDRRAVDGLNDPEYKDRLLARHRLRQAVMRDRGTPLGGHCVSASAAPRRPDRRRASGAQRGREQAEDRCPSRSVQSASSRRAHAGCVRAVL
jgi:hypothetical protein